MTIDNILGGSFSKDNNETSFIYPYSPTRHLAGTGSRLRARPDLFIRPDMLHTPAPGHSRCEVHNRRAERAVAAVPTVCKRCCSRQCRGEPVLVSSNVCRHGRASYRSSTQVKALSKLLTRGDARVPRVVPRRARRPIAASAVNEAAAVIRSHITCIYGEPLPLSSSCVPHLPGGLQPWL